MARNIKGLSSDQVDALLDNYDRRVLTEGPSSRYDQAEGIEMLDDHEDGDEQEIDEE